MKKQHIVILVAVLIGLSLAVAFTVSGANSITGNGSPTVISYQGKVSQNGTPYNGTGYFKFAIVDAAATESFWSNDGTSSTGDEPTDGVELSVTNGFFDILLGDSNLTNMTTLSAAVFNDVDRYLRIWFSSDDSSYSLLTPDQQIAAVPYALQAENANTLDGQSSDNFQSRISDECQIGGSIRAINTDGSIVCDEPKTLYYPLYQPQVLDLSTVESQLKGFYSGFSDGRYGYIVPNRDTSGMIARIDLLDFNPTSVITINLTTIDGQLYGLKGGFTDGRYGYLIPDRPGSGYSGLVARIDLTNFDGSGVTTLNLENVDPKLEGFAAGFTDGRYGYFVPYKTASGYSGKVARLDLTDFSATGVTTLDLQTIHASLNGFYSGFTDGNYAYFVPYLNGLIARVNLNDFSATGVTSLDLAAIDGELSGFIGGFVDAHYAYLVPYQYGKIARIELDNFAASGVTMLDLTAVDTDLKGFMGGFADEGYAYFAPHSNGAYFGKITRVNLRNFDTNEIEVIDVKAIDSNLAGFAGAFSDGRFGYFVPHYDGTGDSSKLVRIPLNIGQGNP